MKKVKNLLIAALAMVCFSTSPVVAASSDFAGPYVGVTAQVAGLELDGTHTDSNGTLTTGNGGFVTPIVGLEVGYNVPVGDMLVLDIAAQFMDTDGTVKGDDAANASDVTVKTGTHGTISIAPTFAFTDSSAVYFKVGWSMMSIHATGNIETTKHIMEGTNFAVGTTSLFPSGMFIKTEAGLHEYDNVNWSGLPGEDESSNTDSKLDVDPTMAYGAIKIGFKF